VTGEGKNTHKKFYALFLTKDLVSARGGGCMSKDRDFLRLFILASLAIYCALRLRSHKWRRRKKYVRMSHESGSSKEIKWIFIISYPMIEGGNGKRQLRILREGRRGQN
jgi:hypothetical protein